MRHLIKALLAIVLLLIAGLGAAWWMARPGAPDTFYSIAGNSVSEPGRLIKAEPYAHDVPAGAKAWRILYATTRHDGSQGLASAFVVAPAAEARASRPVIAWAHGTTGIAPGCAPSVTNPFANVPAVTEALNQGWVIVATDYPGLGTAGGHAYLVGEDAARAVLDSVRAARALPDLRLDGKTVVWGHSQGGNSALWTGQRVRAYAPDVNVVGVAALAPASDLKGLVSASKSSMFGRIVSAYLVEAYGNVYPDVAAENYIKSSAVWLAHDVAGRCVGGWETLVSAAEVWLLPADGVFARDPVEGPLGLRLGENTPREPIAAPVLIAQGEIDDLVLPSIQKGYVESRCAAGQIIDYRTYDGLDHISLVAPNSPLGPDLIKWSHDRFAGVPAAVACR